VRPVQAILPYSLFAARHWTDTTLEPDGSLVDPPQRPRNEVCEPSLGSGCGTPPDVTTAAPGRTGLLPAPSTGVVLYRADDGPARTLPPCGRPGHRYRRVAAAVDGGAGLPARHTGLIPSHRVSCGRPRPPYASLTLRCRRRAAAALPPRCRRAAAAPPPRCRRAAAALLPRRRRATAAVLGPGSVGSRSTRGAVIHFFLPPPSSATPTLRCCVWHPGGPDSPPPPLSTIGAVVGERCGGVGGGARLAVATCAATFCCRLHDRTRCLCPNEAADTRRPGMSEWGATVPVSACFVHPAFMCLSSFSVC